MSKSRSARSIWRRRLELVAAAGLAAACVDETVAPTSSAEPRDRARRVLGFAELTFSGIGTSELSASAIVAPTIEALETERARRDRSGDIRDVVAQDLTQPDNVGGGGDGTIQLSLDTRGQFVFDGVRYLSATFFVRNAQLDGTAYDTDRTNLTFLGVSTSNTIDQTAVRMLQLGGGTPADPSLALEVLPTGLVVVDGDSLNAVHPDVLQALTEAEVAAAPAPAGVTSVFPYGFMVRNATDSTTRTLPASPAVGQFDGVVDFAFQMPEEAQTLSVLMLAVDDSETRLTESLQEQRVAARLALQQRDTTLNADTVTLLPGGTLPGVLGLRTICSVRTAGTAVSPTAHMVNVDWTFDSLTPDPHAADGSASHISSTIDFQAAFSAAADGGGPGTFTVRGLLSGPAFQDSVYSGNGTPTISTPQGSFLPGEEIEIALTNALSCPQPQLARYRVQTTPGTGAFDPDSTYGVGAGPRYVAIGDLNGDGDPDLALPDSSLDRVSVLLNNGNGTFQPQQTHAAGDTPLSVEMGDLDGNGSMDLVVLNNGSNDVSVLLNNGNATFQPQQTYDAGGGPHYGAIGDLDGNGFLDVAVANFGADSVSVLLNNGDGTFQNAQRHNTGGRPASVAVGDLNGDGSLDLAASSFDDASVSVLLNNGDATFSPRQPYATEAGPVYVAIGDLNGNGDLDLAVANQSANSISVLLNTGNGTFQPQQPYDAGQRAHSVAIGDLNGNGLLDIVVANRISSNISVFLNDGGGTFDPQPAFTVVTDPWVAPVGDLNGDGILDLAVPSGASNVVQVLLGQVP